MTPCRYKSKQSYPTLDAAERELKDYKRTIKANKKLINRMNVYKCPDGEHWHLGHNRFKRSKLNYPASIQAVEK